ncbi:MAG: stage V sporulation protein AD, partial [Clostridia bacterium]|nr:stage V sporulation protein AD [Clostridia bacterium]
DLVVTGDLAWVGSDILLELLNQKGLKLTNHSDCGKIIFQKQEQNVQSGGSGCGCIAWVFSGFFAKKIRLGEIKRMLLVCTGALMSPTTYQLGENVVGIAHAVSVCGKGE